MVKLNVNCVVEDILRSVCADTPRRWSSMLPVVEFALNSSVHAFTDDSPFCEQSHVRSYKKVQGLVEERLPIGLLMSALRLLRNR